MADPLQLDEGYSLTPSDLEAPDADFELVQQAATETTAPQALPAAEPPRVGRSYAYDFIGQRFIPGNGGSQPLAVRGESTIRLNVEKALRSARGSAIVHPVDYGLEDADDLIDGAAFEAHDWASLEERITDALTALPWVVDVTDFIAAADPAQPGTVDVAFTVVYETPDGQSSIDVDGITLAASNVS